MLHRGHGTLKRVSKTLFTSTFSVFKIDSSVQSVNCAKAECGF